MHAVGQFAPDIDKLTSLLDQSQSAFRLTEMRVRSELIQCCWGLDVPQFIDVNECHMTSVQQHSCTEDWMAWFNQHLGVHF